MREIATAQAEAGLPRELFDGFAAAYSALAETPLGRKDPESVAADVTLEDVLAALSAVGAGPGVSSTRRSPDGRSR